VPPEVRGKDGTLVKEIVECFVISLADDSNEVDVEGMEYISSR
jgi:hypothetical protein